MSSFEFNRRHVILAAPALLVAGCATETPPAPATPAPAAPATPAAQPTAARPDARVEIESWQVGFIGNATWGHGTLIMNNTRHHFRIRGAGIGGAGMARIRASGEVYNLSQPVDFGGLYGQFRAGAVMPGAQMQGGLWLQNTTGVQLHLVPRRTGLALQVGADGILIEMRPERTR